MPDRILLFEDDLAYARELVAALRAAGFEPIHRIHPDERIIETVLRDNPALISFDVTMPVMDGFTAAERIRRDPRTSGIPFVFLTNMGRDDDQRRGRELGAKAYLVKPRVGLNSILDTYRAVLGSSKQ